MAVSVCVCVCACVVTIITLSSFLPDPRNCDKTKGPKGTYLSHFMKLPKKNIYEQFF